LVKNVQRKHEILKRTNVIAHSVFTIVIAAVVVSKSKVKISLFQAVEAHRVARG
jgi:hypothetical protein